MAFDDFLSKVKETSVNAMDKAKDTTKRISTVNELKSKIRGLKNDKNKLFTQMGMDLYIAKKEDKDITSQVDEFVNDVDRINYEINELKAKLALLDVED
ncbi:MAG: hypothetical protein ACI4F4_05145 [Lachnospiraceae bacterium]